VYQPWEVGKEWIKNSTNGNSIRIAIEIKTPRQRLEQSRLDLAPPSTKEC